jgi:hypothetical protein
VLEELGLHRWQQQQVVGVVWSQQQQMQHVNKCWRSWQLLPSSQQQGGQHEHVP